MDLVLGQTAWQEGLRGIFPPLPPPLFYFATCFGCLLIHPSAPVNDLPARHSPLRDVTNKKATGLLKTSKREGLATDESLDYIIVALFQTDPHGRIATTGRKIAAAKLQQHTDALL